MKDTIPFQGAITFDDAMRADKAIVHKKAWSKSGRLAIALLGSLTLLYMAVQVSFLAALAFVAISAALLWIISLDAKKTRRKNFEARKIDGKGILSADHIELITATQQTKLQWSTFKEVQELDDLLILIEDDEHRLALAPYMFSTQDDWLECRKMIHQVWRSAHGRTTSRKGNGSDISGIQDTPGRGAYFRRHRQFNRPAID